MLRILLIVFLVVLLTAVGVAYSLFSSYQGFHEDVFVDFPKGTPTKAIAQELAQKGVIRWPWQFLLIRAMHPSARLQAGEYRFHSGASVDQVFGRIARGDVFYYELTVPEGSNLFDIAALIDKLGVITSKDFLRAAADTSLIKDVAPNAATLEGYLFPSTYRLTRSTTAEQLCRLMVDQFRHEWKTLATGATSAHVNDAVILASIVEKETAVPAERPLVASVYRNRLRIGMKLDCDPTTIYAALLEDRYRGTIHRSDLQSQNAYNTYQHPGLPPGPITNPGLASLKAALAPAETNYLYFVAKPDGSGSRFSSDYEAHSRAVQEYRRAQSKAPSAR